MKRTTLFVCLAVTLLALPAFATSTIRDAAIAQYPFIDNTRLDSCTLCHTTVPFFNAYGSELQNANLNFASIESDDADGDGFTNIQELHALTFPGDIADVPTVPDVTGMAQLSAETAITEVGFTVGTVTEQSSNTVPAGDVISQLPAAGSQATAGTAINLAVSTGGGGVVAVPDVGGMSQAEATTAITDAGLVLGTVTQMASLTVPAGDVIAQLPTPGTLVTAGSSVNLVISSGATPVTVPNVVGMAQAAAETALTDADLAVGTITDVPSLLVPVGNVVSQDPAAGTQVAAGTAVDLGISAGPISATVPNVVGQTEAIATVAITFSGLTVGTVTTQASSTVPAGSVISQNPTAGTQVAAGTAVALVVSSGPVGLSGSLRVVIEPAGARQEGAQWRVDSGAFRNSGETVSLLAGQHTVSFSDISCNAGCFATCPTNFQRPANQTVTIVAGQTTAVVGTYTEAKDLEAVAAVASSGGDIVILSLIALGFLAARRLFQRNSEA